MAAGDVAGRLRAAAGEAGRVLGGADATPVPAVHHPLDLDLRRVLNRVTGK